MKHLYTFLFALIVFISYNCSGSSSRPDNIGFVRDTVYVKYLEDENMSYHFYPAKINRTDHSVRLDVDIRFTTEELHSDYVSHRSGTAYDHNSFFAQPYAAERFSHMTWSVELNRRRCEGVMTKLTEFDNDSNVIASESMSSSNDEDITALPFGRKLWDLLHTKVKVKTQEGAVSMYMDEFLAIKDSLGVSEKDILTSTSVDF